MYYYNKIFATILILSIFTLHSGLVWAKTKGIAPPPTNKTTSIKPKKTILAFSTYNYPGNDSSYDSLVENASYINQIATVTYSTDLAGNISGLVPANQLNYANKNKITALATISNNFDGNIAKVLLESSINRQALTNNIIQLLKTNGYTGVNMDLEGIYYYDRNYYSQFMKELYSVLHSQGYLVTLSLPAETEDNAENLWTGAYNYNELSKYADEVLIRAYDEHYPGGDPGPIASIGWVESVMKYAVSQIPSKKLLLGIATYGYDWSVNGTKAYSLSKINKIASIYKSQIQWEEASKASFLNYTDINGVSHNVWFESNLSLGYKLNLVDKYNLSGIGIWRIGLENSDYWTTIKNKLK